MPIERLSGITGNVASKPPVRVATTGAITLLGLQTIDGIAVLENDRVLVKNQVDPKQNGIYLANGGTWPRAYDFNGPRDVVRGSLIYVNSGFTQEDSVWRVIAESDPVLPGETDITFAVVEITTDVGEIPDLSDVQRMYDEIVVMHAETEMYRDQAEFWASQALNAASGVPVGIVAWFAAATPPSGWLYCNGMAVSRFLYPDLWREIGTTHGVGDGTTTFNIPDLRGIHIRGYDDGGSGRDPGRAFGSIQNAQVGPHTHSAYTAVTGTTDVQGSHSHSVTMQDQYGFTIPWNQVGIITYYNFNPSGSDGGSYGKAQPLQGATWAMTASAAGAHAHNISISATTTVYSNGTTENRVINMNLLPCIKAIGPASLPRVAWAAQTLATITQTANAVGMMGGANNSLATITQVANGTVTGP